MTTIGALCSWGLSFGKLHHARERNLWQRRRFGPVRAGLAAWVFGSTIRDQWPSQREFKSQPGKINFGSSGTCTLNHMGGVLR